MGSQAHEEANAEPYVGDIASLRLTNTSPRIQGPGSFTFIDHLGHQATSVYEGWSAKAGTAVLPPLWCIEVYVTMEKASIEAIAREMLDTAFDNMNDYFSQRIDIYHLPKASLEDCLAHYSGEKVARQGQPLSLPDYGKRYENYLVLVDKEHWREEGVTLVAFGTSSGQYGQLIQHGVKMHGESGYFAAEGGFLSILSDDEEPGTLGEALVSLYPHRHEDERYTEALDQGKESWT